MIILHELFQAFLQGIYIVLFVDRFQDFAKILHSCGDAYPTNVG